MSDNSGWFWYWWQNILEEQDEKSCPKCGSEKVANNKDRHFLICNNCGYKWEKQGQHW